MKFTSNSLIAFTTLLVATTNAQVETCLQAITGATTILPADTEYATASSPFNYRFTNRPVAVFEPTTELHVQEAVKCATANNIAIAPKSGGHSYMGYSQGGQDGTLMIDLKNLNTVQVDTADNSATCGSGNRLGKLYVDLWNAGEYAFPGGSCPTVGLGGLVLGGGYGFMSNELGLATDSVLEMRMVDAKGDVLVVNKDTNADLFWALRGAGSGSFGIVTSFKLRIYKVEQQVTHFNFGWDDPVNSTAAVLLSAYSEIARRFPSQLASVAEVIPDEVRFYGIFLGTPADAEALFAPLRAAVTIPVSSSSFVASTLIDAHLSMSDYAGTDFRALAVPANDRSDRYWAAGSLMYSRPLSLETAQILASAALSRPSPNPAHTTSLAIEFFGGANSAVSRVPVEETSFVHRQELFAIQVWTSWGNFSTAPGAPNCEQCTRWLNTVMTDLKNDYRRNYGSDIKAYANYADGTLENPLQAYYGSANERLAGIKFKYDPGNTFTFPQAIVGQENDFSRQDGSNNGNSNSSAAKLLVGAILGATLLLLSI